MHHSKRRRKKHELGYVKILEIPENYLTRQMKNQNHEKPPDALPVQENAEARGLIHAMAARGRRFAFITAFAKGVGKMFFIVQGGEQAAHYLGASYESQIPGLKTETVKWVDIVVPNAVIIHLSGKARPLKEFPLEAVYEQLVQRELNVLVCVYTEPLTPLRERLYLYRRRKLFEELSQKRADKKNYQISLRERRLQLEVEYGLVRMGVYLVVYGKTVEEARLNAENLVGSLSFGLENPKPKHLKIASGMKAQKILEEILKLRCEAPMNISRWEASTLLQLPRKDVGVRIRKVATFAHAPTPTNSPSLPVGSLMRDGRMLDMKVGLELRFLDTHVLVVGSTKAGKSNLMLYLCLKLREMGINFIVIEPIKQEYRTLLNYMDINVFTAGDETLCPLRFNPLEVTEGILVATHISDLVEIFSYVFYLWEPMPEFLRMSLNQTYRKKGWNTEGTARGETPNLLDLCDAMEEVARNSTYNEDFKRNVIGAFITRIRSLTVDVRGRMFVPNESMPFEVLGGKPTIFELQNLGGDDQVFVASLLLNWIYENQRIRGKNRGRREGVDMLCIIEEAHRVMGNRKGSFGDDKSHVAEYSSKVLSQLLSEARAFGLGVILVDQYPGRLPEDAMKNTNTKFLLQMPDEEDRKRMGLSIGLDPEQMRAILDFETGVTLLWNQGQPVRQVKVPNLKELGYDLQHVRDELVKKRMEYLYTMYGWREHNPLLDVMPSEVYAQHTSRQENPGEPAAVKEPAEDKIHERINEVINTGKFSQIYRELNQPPYQKLARFLERIAESIASFYNVSDRKEEILSKLQKLAAEKYSRKE